VCGFDVRLDQETLGIEAAHIKWHQAGGPDNEDNGLALCTLHHKTFDRGAFTLSAGREVLVSERAHGTAGFEEWLMRFHGRPILEPVNEGYLAHEAHLAWHRREVFRGPARGA
jgi:putative restriction endonuclease